MFNLRKFRIIFYSWNLIHNKFFNNFEQSLSVLSQDKKEILDCSKKKISKSFCSPSSKYICVQVQKKSLRLVDDLDKINLYTLTDIKDKIFYLTDHILPFNTRLNSKQKQAFTILYANTLSSNPPVYDLQNWNDVILLGKNKIIDVRPKWYKTKLSWLSYVDDIKKVIVHSEKSLGTIITRLLEAYTIPKFKPLIILGFLGKDEALLFRQQLAREFFICDKNGIPIKESVDLELPEDNIFLRQTSYIDFYKLSTKLSSQVKSKGFCTIPLIIPNFSNNKSLALEIKSSKYFKGIPIYNVRFSQDSSCTKQEITLISFNIKSLKNVCKDILKKRRITNKIKFDSLENYIKSILEEDFDSNKKEFYVISPYSNCL